MKGGIKQQPGESQLQSNHREQSGGSVVTASLPGVAWLTKWCLARTLRHASKEQKGIQRLLALMQG